MVLRTCTPKPSSHKFPSPLSRGRLAALLQPRKQYHNLQDCYCLRPIERRLLQRNRRHEQASQLLRSRNRRTRIRQGLKRSRPDRSLKHPEERLRPHRHADHRNSRNHQHLHTNWKFLSRNLRSIHSPRTGRRNCWTGNNLDTIRSGEEEGDRSTPSHWLQEEYDTLRIPARKQLRGASRNTDRNSPRNRPRLRHSHKPRFWTNLRHTVDIAA